MTNIENFVMELRPHLQSCNVFVKFKQKMDPNTRINLKINEIKIISSDIIERVPISNYKIIPSSLSCLQIVSDSVSFRFLTENLNKSTGQFKSELVLFDNSKEQFNNNYISENIIENEIEYKMKCNNCSNGLSNAIQFQRVLPLPSDGVEPAEWFCHKHGETELNLDPKLKDCFYSKCYIHLNQDNLLHTFTSKNNILICKKCFCWLGLKLKFNTVQLWLNTINLTSKNPTITSKPLPDFISTVKNCIGESILGFTKFVFETANLNSNIEYLSVWVLEKKLRLYVKSDRDTFKDIEVAKVLFKFDTELTDLLTSWMNDVKVSQIKISKPMMVAGLNHLYEMSQLIPACYSKSNEYFVSYLIL